MQISLNHLRPGMDARVISCRQLSGRLNKAGLIPGMMVHCCCRSSSGQDTVLLIRGRYLWVQTRELEKIRVTCP